MSEKSKKPAFDAYVVDGDGEEAFWTKIGAAWPHDDDKGLNVQLTALPFSGRIVLRLPKEPTDTKKSKATRKKDEGRESPGPS